MSKAEEDLEKFNLRTQLLTKDDEDWKADWVADDDRDNKNNPWLTSNDTSWVDSLYSLLYPLPKTARHQETFTNILLNLSLRRGRISIQLAKAKYKDTHLPSSFLPSSVTEICDTLDIKGYINLERGHKLKGKRGTRSTVEPTQKLLALIPTGMEYAIHEEGLVIPKNFTPATFPPSALEVRKLLSEYNKTVEYENMLYATHKGSFDVDGRFTGSAVQRMSKEDRKDIRIDGEATIEMDISNCIPFLLLASIKDKLQGDAYDIDGIPRKLVKKSLLIAANNESREKARRAIQQDINFEYKLSYNAGYVLDQIELHHPNIVPFLYEGVGRKLMNLESECMAKFMRSMLDKGIKFYPIYDSVRVPISKRQVATEELRKAFTVNGIEPEVHED